MNYKTEIESLYSKEFEILRDNGKLVGDWLNVYQHCKTEGIVALIISDLLDLPDEERNVLTKAAILHDWYKRHEREASIKDPDEYNKAAEKSRDELLKLGVDKRVVDVAHSVGHTSLSWIKTAPDFIKKVMHFIDDITHGSTIVGIDKRIDQLEKKEDYKELNESGMQVHNGQTYFEVQRETGHLIQKEIEDKISQKKPDVMQGSIVDFIKKHYGTTLLEKNIY